MKDIMVIFLIMIHLMIYLLRQKEFNKKILNIYILNLKFININHK